MTLLAVAYLLAIGCSYCVLTHRDRVAQREAPEITGTVIAIRGEVESRWKLPGRTLRIAEISYSVDGRDDVLTSPLPARHNFAVGDRVPLAHHHDASDPSNDVVVVKGVGLRRLWWTGMAHLAAGLLLGVLAVVSEVRSLRKPRRKELRKVTRVPVAAAAVDHQGGQ